MCKQGKMRRHWVQFIHSSARTHIQNKNQYVINIFLLNPQQPPQEVKLPDGQRLAYRMDYMLKETGNTYIQAITSHTAYWSNPDLAYFMLTKIHPELDKIGKQGPKKDIKSKHYLIIFNCIAQYNSRIFIDSFQNCSLLGSCSYSGIPNKRLLILGFFQIFLLNMK